MADLFDITDAIKSAQKLGKVAKIMATLKKIQAGNTEGLQQPSGPSNNGGGGGGGGAPVSTLAGLPQTPELKALIDKGLIREGMAPEQALAIMQIQGLLTGLPIDIDALQAQITADYAKYSGDITNMGADWMQQMMGQNMPGSPPPGTDYRNGQYFAPDGTVIGTGVTEDSPFVPTDPTLQAQARMYAADPMFTGYANSLAEQQATANTNLNTDLAWFDKQQQMMTDYYNSLQAGMSAGTIATGPGGGGGGGRGGRGGGGGGGNGNYDNALGFNDMRTQDTATETTTDTATSRWEEEYPDMFKAISEGFTDPDDRQYAINLLESYSGGPDQLAAGLVDTEAMLQAEQAKDDEIQEENLQWEATAGDTFNEQRDAYLRSTGQMLGDIPGTPEVEWIRPAVEGEANYIDPAEIDNQAPLLPAQQARNDLLYNPSSNTGSLRDIYDAASHGYGNVAPQQIADLINSMKYMQGLAQKKLEGQQPAPPAPETTTDEEGNEVVVGSMDDPNYHWEGGEPIAADDIQWTTMEVAPGVRIRVPAPFNPGSTGAEWVPREEEPANTQDVNNIMDIVGRLRANNQGNTAVSDPNSPEWIEQDQASTLGPNGPLPSGPPAQDPLAAGLSPTQRYQNSGRDPQDILEGFKNLVARNRQYPLPNAQAGSVTDLPTDNDDLTHYNVQLPTDAPQGMEVDPVTGEFQPTQEGRNAYAEAMGIEPTGPQPLEGVNFQGGGGGSLNTVATIGNAPNAAIMNVIRQVQGLRPQQEDPTQTIAEVLQGLQNQGGGWGGQTSAPVQTGDSTEQDWLDLLETGDEDVTPTSLREEAGAYTPGDWETAWAAHPTAGGNIRGDALRAIQNMSRAQRGIDITEAGYGPTQEGLDLFEDIRNPEGNAYYQEGLDPEARTDLEGDAYVLERMRELLRPFDERWGMVETGRTVTEQDREKHEVQQRQTSYNDIFEGITNLIPSFRATNPNQFDLIAPAQDQEIQPRDEEFNEWGSETDDPDYDLENPDPLIFGSGGTEGGFTGGRQLPAGFTLNGAPTTTLPSVKQPTGFGWQTGGSSPDMARNALSGANLINQALTRLNTPKPVAAKPSGSGWSGKSNKPKVSSVQQNQVSDIVKQLKGMKAVLTAAKKFGKK